MGDHQTDNAFQKQDAIIIGSKRLVAKKGGAGGEITRYYSNIGLGFKTPKEAIEGTYIDEKCPFTGNVSIRGGILQGVVQSRKMKRTIIIRRDYLHYVSSIHTVTRRGTRTSLPTAHLLSGSTLATL
eukprot:EC118641.1.p1 GENE.EC118641.1~~EC118641.1.p1  ORF type:complete len:127 (+),score=15.52 EC118641.1:36-416(+)